MKKYNQIIELTNFKKLDRFDFANLFYVVEKNENSYFNINKTIEFVNLENTSSNFYTIYEVSATDSWASISFVFYKTYKLWWIICKFNNIKNPFTELTPGKLIKIPNKDLVDSILTTIGNNDVY